MGRDNKGDGIGMPDSQGVRIPRGPPFFTQKRKIAMENFKSIVIDRFATIETVIGVAVADAAQVSAYMRDRLPLAYMAAQDAAYAAGRAVDFANGIPEGRIDPLVAEVAAGAITGAAHDFATKMLEYFQHLGA